MFFQYQACSLQHVEILWQILQLMKDFLHELYDHVIVSFSTFWRSSGCSVLRKKLSRQRNFITYLVLYHLLSPLLAIWSVQSQLSFINHSIVSCTPVLIYISTLGTFYLLKLYPTLLASYILMLPV